MEANYSNFDHNYQIHKNAYDYKNTDLTNVHRYYVCLLYLQYTHLGIYIHAQVDYPMTIHLEIEKRV